jgi:hypothetical protein
LTLIFDGIQSAAGTNPSGTTSAGGVASGAIAVGSNAFSIPSGSLFLPADVGKIIRVVGAETGGSVLDTTILSYISPTEVLLSTSAAETVTAAPWYYGTDQAPAIQALINAGRKFCMPAGLGLIGKPLSVPGNIMMAGNGKYSTLLLPPVGQDGVDTTVPNGGYSTIFEDFGVLWPAVGSGGTAFYATASTWEHTGFEARGVGVFRANCGFAFGAASYWGINQKTYIQDSLCYGIFVQNTNVADSGDSSIDDVTIFNPNILKGSPADNEPIAIAQTSGGGLRVVNTKTNGFIQAYQLNLAEGAKTSILVFDGCSHETQRPDAQTPLVAMRPDTNEIFGKIIVNACEFLGYQYTGNALGGLMNEVGGSWLTYLEQSANVLT